MVPLSAKNSLISIMGGLLSSTKTAVKFISLDKVKVRVGSYTIPGPAQ